jgi:GWxTD domain-containing protein
MTADEKRTWAQLANDGERAEFVEKFWAARNPNGEGGENTFKTGFERRVAFADA